MEHRARELARSLRYHPAGGQDATTSASASGTQSWATNGLMIVEALAAPMHSGVVAANDERPPTNRSHLMHNTHHHSDSSTETVQSPALKIGESVLAATTW